MFQIVITYRLARTAGLFLFGAAMMAQICMAQLKRGEPATITMHIVDSYGKPVGYKVERFHDVEKPEIELAGQFEGLIFKHAIQGKTYEFRLAPLPETKGFPAFNERITVGEAQTFAFFAVPESIFLPDSTDPYPITRMLIKPAPATHAATWAIVRPAFLPQVYDPGTEAAPVDREGNFTLHGLHGGRFIITVCQDNDIIGVAIVDIPYVASPKPLEIHLSKVRME